MSTAEDTTFEALGTPGPIPEFTMMNDPALFGDTLNHLFCQHAGWRGPKDQASGGRSPPGPIADHLSNLRVAAMMRLIPGTCTTQVQYEQGLVVRVRTIDGSEVRKPAAALTVTEWLRVLVSEITNSGALRKAAENLLPKSRLTGRDSLWGQGA